MRERNAIVFQAVEGGIQMLRKVALAGAIMLGTSTAAEAQTLAAVSPFAQAAKYRELRGETRPATIRYRFEFLETLGSSTKTTPISIDVGPDWAIVRRAQQTVLHDYRLDRRFVIRSDGFTVSNGLGPVVSRVLVRQNNAFVRQIVGQSAAVAECNADAEAGFGTRASKIDGQPNGAEFVVRCEGQAIGGITPGKVAAAPPAALWPTLFAEMVVHPALFAILKRSGRVPAKITSSYNIGPIAMERSWRLVATEPVQIAFPLTDGLRNATADALDELVAPGAGRLAEDTVAGRAQGGAPTAETWNDHLKAIERRDGVAAAAMLALPSANMFPQVVSSCRNGSTHAICAINAELPRIVDPGPMATLQIALAEQDGVSARAIEQMKKAQASTQKGHPALGAAFALAVLKFKATEVEEARAADLPVDAKVLQGNAVAALPYNPAYWTDIGDRYRNAMQFEQAFLLYDVALAIPMPEAVAANPAIAQKAKMFDQIRAGLPYATLQN